MRAHIVENGKVTGTIEVESLNFLPNLITAENGGKVGDLWDGSVFTTPYDPDLAARIAELERINEVEAAQELHGLKNYTVAQAESWVTNKIDNVGTVSDVKEAIKEILLKMVPYLLK